MSVKALRYIFISLGGSSKFHLGVVLNSDFDQFNPDSPKENDWIIVVFILHGFSLGMWGRSHGNIEHHTGVRVCPLGVLTDGGVPEIPVCGVPICLCHHHCGNPPHHGHSDYWLSAPHNHVFLLWNQSVIGSDQIRSDQSLSRVRLFVTPWIAARQASLSITNSRSSLRLMSIESDSSH